MLEDSALDELSTWAAGVGPDKNLLIRWQQHSQQQLGRLQEGSLVESNQSDGGVSSDPLIHNDVRARVKEGSTGDGGGDLDEASGMRESTAGHYVSTGLLKKLHMRGLQVRGCLLICKTINT
jgi:hypothetical protein